MIRIVVPPLVFVLSLGAQDPAGSAPAPSVEQLVQQISEREKGLRSVELTMQTTGEMGEGTAFETSGKLRVLRSRHEDREIVYFHADMNVEFGDGMTAETETVRNDDGLWMREKDPVQGEVFTHMTSKELERVESATRYLQEIGKLESSSKFGGGGMEQGPLGSSMLEDLERRYNLEVAPKPTTVDGRKSWVVRGRIRGDEKQAAGPYAPDQVDILVTVEQPAVVRMAQLRDGKEVMRIDIEKIDVDGDLDPESFALEVPEGVTVRSVRDHPPAWAQLERLTDDAEAESQSRDPEQRWKDPYPGWGEAGEEPRRPGRSGEQGESDQADKGDGK